MQIFLGAALGLLIAVAIGAAFIAVWFTKASDLWAKSESLWEGSCVFKNHNVHLFADLCMTCRHIRTHCISHDLRDGDHHAQNGSRQSEMEDQTSECF